MELGIPPQKLSKHLVCVFHCVQILCQAPDGTTLNLDSNSRASVNVSSSSLFVCFCCCCFFELCIAGAYQNRSDLAV